MEATLAELIQGPVQRAKRIPDEQVGMQLLQSPQHHRHSLSKTHEEALWLGFLKDEPFDYVGRQSEDLQEDRFAPTLKVGRTILYKGRGAQCPLLMFLKLTFFIFSFFNFIKYLLVSSYEELHLTRLFFLSLLNEPPVF